MKNEKTSFQKGNSGRPKGKPNKITGTLRQWVNGFIENNTEQIEADFKALEAKDRVLIFEKLLRYSLPTLQATSLNIDFEKLSDEQLDEIINRLKNPNHE